MTDTGTDQRAARGLGVAVDRLLSAIRARRERRREG